MRRTWPDLAYRARRAEARKTAAPEKEGVKLGDVLAVLLSKVVEESIGQDREMTEDGYIAHLKDCVTCRKNVATFARMGMKISSRILVAAGVEVLN